MSTSDPDAPPDLRQLETVDRANLETHASPARSRGGSGLFQAGTTLGPYRLEVRLGQGGFGEVWRAEHSATGRRVALKVLTAGRTASAEARDRFRREGRLAASLNHPHCVGVFSAEEVDGYPAITMELMPGGTLQDEIDRAGGMPVPRAVDYILDLLDGLEAAAARGILHRDLKPSNIFIDDQGRAKVGDFGLSKSLEGDPSLTATGAFLGTPSFSSPEQVRGREVDLRSDLYAVGATLYALLSGRPPFTASSAGEVLARILSEPPPPLTGVGVNIPRPLAAIIQRCMRKDPGKRYASYSRLRFALLPYSSRLGGAPAPVGQRLLAYSVDFLLLSLLSGPLELLWRALWSPTAWVDPKRGFAVADAIGGFVVLGLYFFVTEGLFPRGSPGKRLLRLRVIAVNGTPVGPRRALARVLVFAGFVYLPLAIGLAATTIETDRVGIVGAVSLVLLAVTMRQRNGYAGLHDLVSGTRVSAVRRRVRLRRPRTHALTGDEVGGFVGPFRLLRSVWQVGGRALQVAHDDQLRRDVWIHWRPAPCPPPAGTGAAFRLPWLVGAEVGGRRWDAYAAPAGIACIELVRRQGRVEWRDLLPALTKLAGALAERDSAAPAAPISLRHLWLDGDGMLKLLDFPVTLDGQAGDPEEPVDSESAPGFLRRVVRSAVGVELDGDPLAALERASLPESAVPVVRRLCASDPRPGVTAKTIAADLERLHGQPTHLTRRRRSGPFQVLAVPVLITAVLLAGVAIYVRFAPAAHKDILRGDGYLQALRQIEADAPRKAAAVDRERDALRMLLARSHRLGVATELIETSLEALEGGDLALLEAALRAHPSPSVDELAAARELIHSTQPDLEQFELPAVDEVLEVTIEVVSGLAWLATFAVSLAFLVRGGPLLRLFGICVQRRGAWPAGRWLCAARAVVAWSPFLAMLLVSEEALGKGARQPLIIGLLAVAIAGSIYAILRPSRGIPDLIVRTRLVPK